MCACWAQGRVRATRHTCLVLLEEEPEREAREEVGEGEVDPEQLRLVLCEPQDRLCDLTLPNDMSSQIQSTHRHVGQRELLQLRHAVAPVHVDRQEDDDAEQGRRECHPVAVIGLMRVCLVVREI